MFALVDVDEVNLHQISSKLSPLHPRGSVLLDVDEVNLLLRASLAHLLKFKV